MGGVGDGAAEEDGSWDLNPGAAAKERERERGPCGFGREGRGSCSFGEVSREDHAVLGCSFLPCSSGIRRDFAEKKRGERTLAGGR